MQRMVKLGVGMLHNNPQRNKFTDPLWQIFTDDEN